MTTTHPLVLWHGARGWTSPPTLRAAKRGRVEHGPGLYLTTSYETARRYAKGGGSTLQVALDPDLRWLQGARVPVADVLAWVAAEPRLPGRAALQADLVGVAAREARLAREGFPAASLVNLLINADAAAGPHGPSLATFLVAHEIDASWVRADGEEDWVVVFNLAKVRGVTRVDAPRRGVPPDAPRVPSPRG